MNIADKIFSTDFVSFPEVLLSGLKEYRLTMAENYLLLQIWHLCYHQKKIVTDDLLVAALSSTEGEILEILAGLIAKNCLGYTEKKNKMAYNLEPLIASVFAERENDPVLQTDKGRVFEAFESEFKRPLSPIEIDLVDEWMDERSYPESMIIEVLKVAVTSGKLSFKYIDHILIDWTRKGVTTEKENQQKEVSKKSVRTKASSKEPKSVKKGKYDDIYQN